MFRWIAIWLALTVGFVVSGGILGSILFPIVGLLAGMEYPVMEMLRNGAFDGAFLALIWAPGGSFVICLMLAKKRKSESGG